MKYAWIVLFLVGCGKYVPVQALDDARKLCEPFGGLYALKDYDRYSGGAYEVWAVCNDGTKISKRYAIK